MDASSVAKMYFDAVKNDTIEASILTKLPELVTCPNWKNIEIVGRVNYISQRTKIVYDGIVVKYAGGLYYMRKKVVNSLAEYDKRFSRVTREIKVV
ncbi:MAG: hypothetical protein ACP5QT_04230 [Brevinematia bacterium]